MKDFCKTSASGLHMEYLLKKCKYDDFSRKRFGRIRFKKLF